MSQMTFVDNGKPTNANLSAYEQRICEMLAIDETSPTGLRWHQLAWRKAKGKPAGSLGGRGYWQVGVSCNGVQRVFRAHRVVWFLAHGRWPIEEIDHINGDRGDNRLSNLREASCGENNRNQVIRATNTSGVKGVSFHKSSGKWQAGLWFDRKRIHIGSFINLADAERAVIAVREKLHGEFANHGANKGTGA